jgi:hypothetical protein
MKNKTKTRIPKTAKIAAVAAATYGAYKLAYHLTTRVPKRDLYKKYDSKTDK